MDCGQFRTLYSDFADGQLDELTEIDCHRHLAECEPCRRHHAAYRAGCALLRRQPRLTPSADFAARLGARLAGAEPVLAAENARQWVALAGAVMVVVVIAATGWTLVDSWPAAPIGVAGPTAGSRGVNPFVVRFAGDTSLDYPGPVPIIPVSRTSRPASTPAQFEVTVDWMEP